MNSPEGELASPEAAWVAVALLGKTRGKLVPGERREDNAGADRVDARAALAPAHRFGHDPQRIPALGNLIGVERVRHLLRLQHGDRKSVV